MTALCYRSAWELAALIARKELSPFELMRRTVERIGAVDADLNAFVSLRPEQALAEAAVLTEAMAKRKITGPLTGLPIGVKDLEDVAGMVTSYGSVPFKGNVARQDSIQVARLKAAGAIVVGKTNTPEFGYTGFTKNRLFGVTRNPWNLARTPGGSSGGSAAAVAGGLVPFCTGSDAGGSIRIPASYSGCVGFKPSYGRIPLGPLPFVSFGALTVLGPLARSVKDAALYVDCTAGPHPADPQSLPAPQASYTGRIEALPSRLKIAFSPTLGLAAVERPVMALVESAVSAFEEMGHRLEHWTGALPEVGAAWSALVATDIYAHLCEVLEKERPQIGRTLVSLLERTAALTVADLAAIQRLRAALNDGLAALFDRYDLLLTPTMPTTAFAAGGPPPSIIDGRRVSLLGAVAFTYPFNLSGHPAVSVPVGCTAEGLPVGLQIVAPRHRDLLALQAAHAFETVRPWHHAWPLLQDRTANGSQPDKASGGAPERIDDEP